MGIMFSKLWRSLFKPTPINIIMFGLDVAGKTAILYGLKLKEFVPTSSTIAFNAEDVEYENLTFHVWDVSHQTNLKPLWRTYYRNTHALVFVVDYTDGMRLQEGRADLLDVLDADELRHVPVLIFANKCDLPDAMSVTDLTTALQLEAPSDRLACSARTGVGLLEGLDWLAKNYQRHRENEEW